MSVHPKVVFLGHSEAGSAIAGELIKAGFDVVGFDSAVSKSPVAPRAASLEEAVAGAAVVLSLGPYTAPSRVAERVVPLLGKGAHYGDLSTGTPAVKKELAALFDDGIYADIAVAEQDPVAGEIPALDVAGTGARKLIELLKPSGLGLEYVSEVAGEATARRLFRSLLAKGMAGVITDSLWAAESLGLQNWAYQEILEEFESHSAETAKRYLSGTALHVKRRQIEIMDVVGMLNETGYESTMIAAIEFTYGRILHGKKIPFSKAQ
jgi:3-hydroxyisobutyrate dehydrogenase-like beta-hydroxyacid dehydrogenase